MEYVDPIIYAIYMLRGNNINKMIYVKLNKALYGWLQIALMFYQKLRVELNAYGFVINPCNLWVSNKWVNGIQMKISWHVDDLKISHMDPDEVTGLINYL